MKNLQKSSLLTPEKFLKEVPPSATSTFFGRYRQSIFADICRYVLKNVDICAEKISTKKNERYDDIMRYLRVKLSFLALKATLMCLRGSRTVKKNVEATVSDFTLALNELGL